MKRGPSRGRNSRIYILYHTKNPKKFFLALRHVHPVYTELLQHSTGLVIIALAAEGEVGQKDFTLRWQFHRILKKLQTSVSNLNNIWESKILGNYYVYVCISFMFHYTFFGV